jgi:MSHA pilin protein MshD
MKPTRHNKGFTLIEAIMSILIVGVMYVAALQTLGASRVGQATIADQRRGYELAQQLLAEIVSQPYADPVTGATTFGPEAGEATGNRSQFDDVDDYNGWSEQPPKLKDGTAISNLSDWTRRVTVAWVDPSNLDTNRLNESGIKRITVTISRGLKPIATLNALKANVN